MSSSIFRVDRKFLKDLRDRLRKLHKHYLGSHSKSENIPSVEQLEEIIPAMLWASMQHEEGRLSRFSATFAKPSPLDYLALRFRLPKRLNTEELRKLGPAVLPPDGQIGVWPSDKNGELQIWGLQITSLTGIRFEIIDPGRLTISFASFKVAEITGQRAGFISSDTTREGLEMMSKRPVEETGPLGETLSYLSLYITQQILGRIRLMGHGGAIIFVEGSTNWQQSVDQPIFYACDQHLNEVQRIIEAFRRELPDEKLIIQSGLELINDPRYKLFIGDAARSIAYLSAVDGATVIGREFEVLAFGAKLKLSMKRTKAANPEMVTRILPLEGEISSDVALDEEFRGTRHLSAARFVLNNPDSVVFVVSQDGGITGFIMSNVQKKGSAAKLLAYKGLELLL